MTVVFHELAGSPTETYGSEGIRAQRHVLCAWEDRHDLLVELLGDGYEFGGNTRAEYPDHPGVLAMQVHIEAFHPSPDEQGEFTDIATEVNTYTGTTQFALLTIDYELLVDDIYNSGRTSLRPDLPSCEPNTFLTYRMGVGGEFLRISGATLSWANGDPITEHPDLLPTLKIGVTEHNLTWHRVVYPPWNAIRSLAGCVNADVFMGAAPESLLFEGATHELEFTTVTGLGESLYAHRMSYVFKERRHVNLLTIFNPQDHGSNTQVAGWNHVWRSKPLLDEGWSRILNQSGKPLYEPVDFAPLFQYEVTP